MSVQRDMFDFYVGCMYCDLDSPETIEQAVEEGWQVWQAAANPAAGECEWTHLGYCPLCIADPEQETY